MTWTGALGGLAAEAATAAPDLYEVIARFLVIAAGAWATWAQFVYPKLVDRRRQRRSPDAPESEPRPGPPLERASEPVLLLITGLQHQLDEKDDVIDRKDAELAELNGYRRKDAATIARLTAELNDCRRTRTPQERP